MKTNEKIQIIFAPHPPILISEIGNGQENQAKKTLEAMEHIADLVQLFKPETILYITPHGNSFNNGTCILDEKVLHGDFKAFGNDGLRFMKAVDAQLVQEIGEALDEEDLVHVLLSKTLAKQYGVSAQLDHGVMVPMYFIDQKFSDYKIVHISPGFTSLLEQYKIGIALRKAIRKNGSKVLVVASGDLSHCLKEEGAYTYHPMGQVFDDFVVSCISKFDGEQLITMSSDIFDPAGQCGLRSFCMAFGMFEGYSGRAKVFSYEGPFGVGYLTGSIEEEGTAPHSVLERIENRLKIKRENKRNAEDDYIKLARRTIEHYVMTYQRLERSMGKINLKETSWQEMLNQQAGVFVSLHINGELRGCIGTILPSKEDVVDEIIDNAIQAASADPRFDPLEARELDEVDVKVDILSKIEPIRSKDELDPKRYGVVVEQGDKRGLLLPNLEGVDTVEEQISIAKKKAGISNNQSVQLSRFEVVRHEV